MELNIIKLPLLVTCIILIIFNIAFNTLKADIINDVKVENNKRVTKESIISFGNIKLGEDYDSQMLNQVLKDLYNSSFFSDIKLKIDNNILIIKVVEKKIIQSVIINGVKSKENKPS